MKVLFYVLSTIGYSIACLDSANAEIKVMRTTEALFQHLVGARESFIPEADFDPFEIHAHKAILEVLVSKSLANPVEDHPIKDILSGPAYDILPLVIEVGLSLADDDLVLFFPETALVVARTKMEDLRGLQWLVSAGARDKNLRVSVELSEADEERSSEKFRFEALTKSGQSLVGGGTAYTIEIQAVLSTNEDIVDMSVSFSGRGEMEGQEIATQVTIRVGEKVELANWIQSEAQSRLVLTGEVQIELVYATQTTQQEFDDLSNAIVRALSQERDAQDTMQRIEQ